MLRTEILTELRQLEHRIRVVQLAIMDKTKLETSPVEDEWSTDTSSRALASLESAHCSIEAAVWRLES